MLPTDGSNWYVRELPRRMLVQEERHSDDGQRTGPAPTLAKRGFIG